MNYSRAASKDLKKHLNCSDRPVETKESADYVNMCIGQSLSEATLVGCAQMLCITEYQVAQGIRAGELHSAHPSFEKKRSIFIGQNSS